MKSKLSLAARADRILINHIRPRTQQDYRRIVIRYIRFCTSLKVAAFPPTTESLRLFMADLVEKASGPTIANYISAIRTFYKDRNIPTIAIEDSYAITKSIVALRHLYPSTRKFARNAMTSRVYRRVLDLDVLADVRI